MYNLEFKCNNIFNQDHPYKIHCIGKCQKGMTPLYHDTYYYFISHGKKYEVSEILRGLENINIVVKEVENFELPNESGFEYLLFRKELQQGYKYDLIKKMENMTYSKDGFVIFKQMYYQDNCSALGGIDDVYEYESTNKRNFEKMLSTCKYDK